MSDDKTFQAKDHPKSATFSTTGIGRPLTPEQEQQVRAIVREEIEKAFKEYVDAYDKAE